jgi:hypothetical protein
MHSCARNPASKQSRVELVKAVGAVTRHGFDEAFDGGERYAKGFLEGLPRLIDGLLPMRLCVVVEELQHHAERVNRITRDALIAQPPEIQDDDLAVDALGGHAAHSEFVQFAEGCLR